jgi:hypothetical protein
MPLLVGNPTNSAGAAAKTRCVMSRWRLIRLATCRDGAMRLTFPGMHKCQLPCRVAAHTCAVSKRALISVRQEIPYRTVRPSHEPCKEAELLLRQW